MKLWILIALLMMAPFVGWHFAKADILALGEKIHLCAANANITCGIAPIPPVGCYMMCINGEWATVCP